MFNNNCANPRALIGREQCYESIGNGNDETCHTVPVVLFLVFLKKK